MRWIISFPRWKKQSLENETSCVWPQSQDSKPSCSIGNHHRISRKARWQSHSPSECVRVRPTHLPASRMRQGPCHHGTVCVKRQTMLSEAFCKGTGPAQTTAGKAGTAHRTNQLRNVFAVLLSHHKEWNKAICSNMDGPRDDHTKGTKSEKQMLYNNTYMWDLKYNTNKYNLRTKNGLTDPSCQRSGGGEQRTENLGCTEVNCYIQEG